MALVLAMPAGPAGSAELTGSAAQDQADSGGGAMPVTEAPDPVIAEVDGRAIHLSEVGDAIQRLPDGGAGNSFETLYPIVVGRLVDRTELALRARSAGLDKNPEVVRHMGEADDEVLENAYLRQEGMKKITEGALLARYAAEIAGKPGPEQVHAQVILLNSEKAAEDAIARLGKGADFAAMARQISLDASAGKGGDLGFVSRDELSPEIGAVLFELQPGDVTPYPVRTYAGWFVLKDLGRGHGPVPSFAEAREHLVTELLRQQVEPLTRDAMSTAVVRLYDVSGHELTGNAPSGIIGIDPSAGH